MSEQVNAEKKELTQMKFNVEDFERVAAAALANVKGPATMPAFSNIPAERNGVVWVKNYSPTNSNEGWWARFDSEGHLSGTLEVPNEWRVIKFSGAYAIVGKPKDADGISHITLLSILPVPR